MSMPQLLTVRVARIVHEAEDIASFELVPPQGDALPGFDAGAHIDVHIQPGLVRQYSLYNRPGETHRYRIAVLRDPASRGGSVAMHERVAEGDLIQIGAPRNLFPMAPGRRHLLLAGGIGITPLLAMAETLATRGADFELHYCARSAARTAFRPYLQACAYADRVQFHLDDGAPSQKLDLATLAGSPETDTHIHVCGPNGFIDHVLATFRAHAWPETQLHVERFAAAPAAADAIDGAFEVELARSGRRLHIPAGTSVAQVLHAHGVDLPVSCEQGVCGTCLTRVLDGIPDHRDLYLTPDEQAANNQFTPCCSRALSARLVLDL